jgi:hypothetical protein
VRVRVAATEATLSLTLTLTLPLPLTIALTLTLTLILTLTWFETLQQRCILVGVAAVRRLLVQTPGCWVSEWVSAS